MNIQLSEHFGYRKLLRFTLPSIVMMVFTSIYGVVDGVFVSNYVGAESFAAVNLIMPFLMILGAVGIMSVVLPLFLGIDGVWSAVIAAEGMALVLSLVCLVRNRKKYGYV